MDRKAAIRDYKARKAPRGVFAVRCLVTGEAWIGSSRDLAVAQNGIWFALRNGNHYDEALQRAWDAHGEANFRYEILGQIGEEISDLLLPDELKKAKLKWVAQLGAHALIR
jgi:hypothetical protein